MKVLSKDGNRREVYIDIIRIFAVWLVVFTHTGPMASKYYYNLSNGQFLYVALDVFRFINVPLFFMISGVLLLGKQESVRDIFVKRFTKYLLALLLISYFYFVFYLNNDWKDICSFLTSFSQKPITGHLWFMYEYLGYLLILPFLRCLVNRLPKKMYIYYFVLGIIMKGGAKLFFALFGLEEPYLPFGLGASAIFYSLMGYYFGRIIDRNSIKQKYLLIGIGCSIVSTVLCAYMTLQKHGISGEWVETYEDSLTVITTITIFCTIKYVCEKINFNLRLQQILHWIGNTIFGVYLISVYLQVKLVYVWEKMLLYMPEYIAGLIYVTFITCLGIVLIGIIKVIIQLVKKITLNYSYQKK